MKKKIKPGEHWLELSLKNLPGERWRDIPGYERYYMVSNFGRIKGVIRRISGFFIIGEKIMKQQLMDAGYLRIGLHKGNRRSYSVNRIVGAVFVKNPHNKPWVNHKKGIKTDNRASQLEWVTHSENIQHSFDFLGRISNGTGRFGAKHPMSRKVEQYSMNGKYIRTFDSIRCAYRHLGIKKEGTMYSAAKDFTLSAHGFRWKYENGICIPQKRASKNVFSKLTKKEVIIIFKSKESANGLAQKYSVTNRTIRDIRTGRKWSNLTNKHKPIKIRGHWSYAA